MEDYIGKTCPFCKTEITEADEVKVCPACGVPHHKGCWEENKGCTTFGCSEQHYEAPSAPATEVLGGTPATEVLGGDPATEVPGGSPATEVLSTSPAPEAPSASPSGICLKCGSVIEEGHDFCMKCGTPRGGAAKKVCLKCGAELAEGQEFCAKCGQKVGSVIDAGVSSAIDQFNAGIEKKKKKSKAPIIIVILLVIAAVAVGGVFYYLNTDGYKYKKATGLYDEEKWEEALEIFTDLDDYEDSEDYAKNCKWSILFEYLDKHGEIVINYDDPEYKVTLRAFEGKIVVDYLFDGSSVVVQYVAFFDKGSETAGLGANGSLSYNGGLIKDEGVAVWYIAQYEVGDEIEWGTYDCTGHTIYGTSLPSDTKGLCSMGTDTQLERLTKGLEDALKKADLGITMRDLGFLRY